MTIDPFVDPGKLCVIGECVCHSTVDVTKMGISSRIADAFREQDQDVHDDQDGKP